MSKSTVYLSWKCDNCGLVNSYKTGKCIACFESKPQVFESQELERYFFTKSGQKFAKITENDQLPTLITNPQSLIGNDLNIGFTDGNRSNTMNTSFQQPSTAEFTDILIEQFDYDLDLSKHGIQFVAWRGNLDNIMKSAFLHQRPNYDSFNIDIHKKNNVIYLEKIITMKEDTRNPKPRYWGRKFEANARRFDDENSKKGFNILRKININNKHQILIRTEIDCMNNSGHFVEIKLTKFRGIYNKRYHIDDFIAVQSINDNYKLLLKLYKTTAFSYWTQSYLQYIKYLLIGFRNNDGVVQNVSYIDVNELEEIYPEQRNICINWTDKVLSFIKVNCVDDNLRYRLMFQPPFDEIGLITIKPREIGHCVTYWIREYDENKYLSHDSIDLIVIFAGDFVDRVKLP